ncbi:MAG: YfcC family protein, partial [Gemmatimonadaceae bacterium]
MLTHILPAGQFDRHDDPATGRSVVTAGTYHVVAAHPLGPFETLVSIPDGIIDAAPVIAFVFLVGGAFGVVDRTGALTDGIDKLVLRLGDRGILAVPIVCLAFAAGGAFENMQEEIIGLVPALLLLNRRLGFDAVTAAEMSVGSAAVGAAFSPANPFQVLIAQKVSGIPQLSGGEFRTVFLVVALALWIAGTMRHARRSRTVVAPAAETEETVRATGKRGGAVLLVVVAAFALFVYGVAALGWDFNQEAALFFAMGVIAGLVGGLGVGGTAEAFADGFRSLAYAAILIGFARSISAVMERGLIIDTVVHGIASTLSGLSATGAALGMMAAQAIIHVPVPSVSGQAVLTLPVFAPLADLMHITRQAAVLAYQYGAG